MDVPHGSYPLAICRQGALNERNPVCSLAFRVCRDMCMEYGNIQFNLLKSIETADYLLAHLVENAWDPPSVKWCYNWLENQLSNSPPAIMCACATVSVSISVMNDAPEPLQSLGLDIRCLIYGEASGIYENLYDAVYQADITLSAIDYGLTPTDETEETIPQEETTHSKENMNQQNNNSTVYNGPVYNGPVFQGCTIKMETPGASAQQTDDVTSASYPRYKKLFITPDGEEDIQRTTEECNRFLNFLADHNWSQKLIDSSQDNPINRSIVCFCAKWKALHYVGAKVSPNALLRFLTQTCKLQCDSIDERAIANTLARMIKKGCDQHLFYDVCDYF